jgi:hypothetical protein
VLEEAERLTLSEVGITLGVGSGVGATPLTVSATLIVTRGPTEDVIVTVAEYDPGFRLLLFTEKVTGELAPALSLPVPGVTVNQLTEGEPMAQPRLLPPVLVILTVCDAGLLPCVAVNERLVLSTCMAGGVILIVIVSVVGLPTVGDGGLVTGFTALIVTPKARV